MATNARQFTTAGDPEIEVPKLGALGPLTIAAIVYLDDITAVKIILSSGQTTGWTFFVQADESVAFYNNVNTRSSAVSRVTTATWYLVAVTKATGSTLARFHIYNYSTPGWVHENGGGTQPDPPAGDGTDALIGQDNGSGGSPWNGRIQVAALWNSTALSDPTLEGMVSTRLSWLAASPTNMWTLNQASTATAVTDEVGSANQTGLVATSVTTGNPDWDDSTSPPWTPEQDSPRTLRTVAAPRL